MIASTSPEQYRAEAAQHDRDAHESFERCDTDGFVSQWASGIMGQVARANAEIAENGGTATFWRYVVRDLSGQVLEFRRCNTRFGFKLLVTDATGNEVWIDPHARTSTNERKGIVIEREEFTLPAHANTWAPAGSRGLGGACNVTVRIFPDDRDVQWDGVAR